MVHLLFTGGGTAGHVTPNLALIEAVSEMDWRVSYAGSAHGIEREMVSEVGVDFHAVSSGKLRRYFSWENFIDPFRIVFGVLQSLLLCLRLRPDVVFSKGGFVAVPVVVAAWLLRIPVVCHESDVTPGLANKLTYRFCKAICVTFAQTRQYLPEARVIETGTPLRLALIHGDAERGKAALGLAGTKPVLLVFGGSLGAGRINTQVRAVLPTLLAQFQIVHVTGTGQVDAALEQPGYIQKPFIAQGFGDVLAAADIVVSRAGANSLYELFALRKPHLLVPLTRAASRGDQLENAALFERLGFSRVLQEDELSNERFIQEIVRLLEDAESIRDKLREFAVKDSIGLILGTIKGCL